MADKEYWGSVAKSLGVELGEHFKVDGLDDTFKVTLNGIKCIYSEWVQPTSKVEIGILYKTLPITPKPWKPKVMEKYWFVKYAPEFDEVQVSSNTWWGDEFDLANFATKNCFKTEAEAKKDGRKIIYKLCEVYRNAV